MDNENINSNKDKDENNSNLKNKLKKLNFKDPNLIMVIISASVIFVAVIAMLVYLVAYFREDTTADASGRADVAFRVHYLENDFFPTNPLPRHLHYLISFTDFFEVDSRFSAQFSEEVEVHYMYTAEKRFVIRHMSTGDANLNPMVFEETHVLSTIQGIVTTDGLNFSPNGNGAGGTYAIFPKDYTELYFDFVAAQARMMEQENVIAQNLRGFTAELFIDFVYRITIPEWDIIETVRQGYRIQLSNEIYSFVMTGNSGASFTRSITINNGPQQLSIFWIIVFVAIVSGSVYALLVGLSKLLADPNERKRMIKMILKKYANEIVVSDMPLPLAQFNIMRVEEFESLLKLAINLGKHIMCYSCDEYAEFAVTVEGNAYYFKIECADEPEGTVEVLEAVDIKEEKEEQSSVNEEPIVENEKID